MTDESGAAAVPPEVAAAVAAFLRARLSEVERSAGVGVKGSADWRDQLALVREWEHADSRRRVVTAENLALTMLVTAARYRAHRSYDPAWDAWQPFGDLEPPTGR